MDTFLQDLKYGFRSLLAKPGFLIAAIATLALGIGANTAIFSVINGSLLRPLPWPEADRLVQVYNTYPKMLDYAGTSIPDFLDRKEQAPALENLAIYNSVSFNLALSGAPQRLTGLRATPSLFATLKVQPQIGRAFTDEDAVPGRDKVVVLSNATWKTQFNADPNVVGRELRMNGETYTVVGVMREGFFFPNRANQLFVPFAFEPKQKADDERGNEYSESIGRLKPGATVSEADAQFDAIVKRNADRLAASGDARGASFATWLRAGNFTGRAKPLREQLVGNLGATLLMLQAVTLFVLLIVCANVANLMLTRVSARYKELSVRTALGAGRARIARQLLIESVMLSGAGALVGVALAYFGVKALAMALGIDVENGQFEFTIDAAVLAYSIGVALVVGVVSGLFPVASMWGARPFEVLKEGGRNAGGGRSAKATRNVLVVAQMALAVTLLVGAGLMLKSFSNLMKVTPGFTADGVLTARIDLSDAKFKDDKAKTAFFDRLLAEARAIPGAKSVGIITGLPFSQNDGTASYAIEGQERVEGQSGPHGHIRVVDEDYLKALDIPLLSGRAFQPNDTADAAGVVLIDEYMAKTQFPNGTPIGRRITLDDRTSPTAKWFTIVGVVGTVKHSKLAEDVKKETYYFYYKQLAPPQAELALKTDLATASMIQPLRDALRRVDPDQPLYDIKTLDDRVRVSLADRRAPMQLLLLFAAVALILSAIGIYGVLAYAVASRTGELGVRMAIGAQKQDILGLVLKQGGRLAAVGLGIGLVGSFALTRMMQAQLFGVSASDPLTFVVVIAVLGAVALLACWLPARRAAAVNPIEALRYE